MPWILKNYQVDEVTTVQRLRSQIATHFRQVPTDNYKVIDVRLFKARAEMTVSNVVKGEVQFFMIFKNILIINSIDSK